MSKVGLPVKRKQLVLTLETKLEIIAKLEKGATYASIANAYNVGISIVSDLKKNQDKIKRFQREAKDAGAVMNRCVIRKANDDAFDKAIHLWFTQERAKGTTLSGIVVMEKARLMYASMYPDRPEGDFKASNGWLNRFKHRHGIRCLSMQGETLSADTGAASSFKGTLQQLMEDNVLTLDQVFNADETGRIIFQTCPVNGYCQVSIISL